MFAYLRIEVVYETLNIVFTIKWRLFGRDWCMTTTVIYQIRNYTGT